MTRTEYTIRPTDLTYEARAAAGACNRELIQQEETASREAAEAQIASCAPCLRDALEIVAEDVEYDDED